MSRSDVVDDVVPNNNQCGYGVTIYFTGMSNDICIETEESEKFMPIHR